MAHVVQQVLQSNPSYRIVTITGSIHASEGRSRPTMASILEASAISLASVLFTGAGRETHIGEVAEKIGLGQYRFMLPARINFPEGRSRPTTDWVVHVPPTEKDVRFQSRRPKR